MREFMSLPFFLYLSKTPEKPNFSYLFFTTRMVPIGKHIFSFAIISSVLSFVWYLINNKHAEDYITIYLSKSGNNIPVPKKRGAPNGHKGATRPTKEPDEIIDVIADHCEKCNSSNLEKQDKCQTSVIEDLPPPQKIKITQYNLWEVKCKDCGHKSISKHPDCPKIGNFGIFLLVYIVMLKFHLRGVIRKIQDFVMRYNDFEISTKGINDILLRVGSACKKDYEEKVQKIRSAKWRYIDETGIKVNGENWWLWIFRTDTNETLVVIRKSRGAKVLEEILGLGHKGANIADGWRAYSLIDKLQRCWAHLLREVDHVKDTSENGKRLSEDIHASFKKLRDFRDRDPSI